jgi:hypothetical protein
MGGGPGRGQCSGTVVQWKHMWNKVDLLCESVCAIYCVANLTEEKSYRIVFEFPTADLRRRNPLPINVPIIKRIKVIFSRNILSFCYEVCMEEEVKPIVRKNGVFWDVTPCGSCKNRRFGGT